MALRLSTGLRDKLLGTQSFKDSMAAGVIRVFSGVQPSSSTRYNSSPVSRATSARLIGAQCALSRWLYSVSKNRTTGAMGSGFVRFRSGRDIFDPVDEVQRPGFEEVGCLVECEHSFEVGAHSRPDAAVAAD